MLKVDNKNLCELCFSEIPHKAKNCPNCDEVSNIDKCPTALLEGTVLAGRYVVGKVLGKGGFGITYRCFDMREKKIVAIKEYLPDSLAHRNTGDPMVLIFSEKQGEQFKEGAKKFYEEAKTVAKFTGNANIINVYEFFYENNTSYFVMEYLDGTDLKKCAARKGGTLKEGEAVYVIEKVAEALSVVHETGILHRDISPDNIFLSAQSGDVKLIDFGAARYVVGEASKSLSVILKQGFAPLEQYQRKGNQGPWTDIYALGATFYYVMTKKVIDDAMTRLEDDTIDFKGISEPTTAVLKKMLAVDYEDRYQNTGELLEALKALPVERANPALTMPTKAYCSECGKQIEAGEKMCVECKRKKGLITGHGTANLTRNGNLTKSKSYTARSPMINQKKSPVVPIIIAVTCFLLVAGAALGIYFGVIKNDAVVEKPGEAEDAAMMANTLNLNKSALVMTPGQAEHLEIMTEITDEEKAAMFWASSNFEVVGVDSNGNITAKNCGEATIMAIAGAKQGKCNIVVSEVIVEVLSVKLNETSKSVTVGDSFKLEATVETDHTEAVEVTWMTSDEKIATVDSEGNVKTLGAGVVTISVFAGDKTASCEVTVNEKKSDKEATDGPVDATGVEFGFGSISLEEGDVRDLYATVKPDNAKDKTLTWTSSDESVVKVDERGRITAVKEGYAVVTATTVNGKSASVEVNVTKKAVRVTKVTLDKSNLVITAGNTAVLTATVTPDNATNKKVYWSSSDPSIATVDENGTITAKSEGRVSITATADGKKAQCAVKVEGVDPTGVTLNNKSITLGEGQTTTLYATVQPSTGKKKLTWNSSNTSVATVDENGKVKGVKAGSATITVKTVNGKSATCNVTVTKTTVAVTGVKLDKSSLTLTEGESVTIKATVSPSNATNNTVVWNSSDTNIATVNNGKITAKKAGTVKITATADGKSATCAVTVKKIEATKVTLNKTKLTLKAGTAETLKATVEPSGASQSVTWISSNNNVATVDSSGKVTAKSSGNATITVKTSNGKTATCTVTVEATAPTSVAISPSSVALEVGESTTLKATVSPSGASQSVTWSSGSSSIATVDSNGKVTGKAAGTATITAKTSNGKSATCTVTVRSSIPSGVCGANCTWTLIDGTLTISGSGDMYDSSYNYSDASASTPWYDHISEIKKVVISEGIASIGKYSFYKCSRITSVTIPSSVRKINNAAFRGCSSLTSVTLPYNLTEIGNEAFEGCTSISSTLTIPKNVNTMGYNVFKDWIRSQKIKIEGKSATPYGWNSNWNIGCNAQIEWDKSASAPTESTERMKITLSSTSLSMAEGDMEVLIATVTPANSKKVQWKTSNSSVAKVSSSGTVTAVGTGSATITAYIGDVEATCDVRVSYSGGYSDDEPVRGVTLSRDQVELTKGDSTKLTLTVTPSNAVYTSVKWTTSDASVATVSYGTVKGVGVGRAVVTVNVDGHKATCIVDVVEAAPKEIKVQEIEMEGSLSMSVGDTHQLNAKVIPSNATNSSISWKSSNTNVATVENGLVRAVGMGSATITAVADGVNAKCTVNVSGGTSAGSGKCGANATYTISGNTLIISGSGAISDFDFGRDDVTLDSPWFSATKSITSIEIREGITRIGDYSFYEFTSLRSVVLPESLREIGAVAFEGCTSLSSIYLPSNLQKIEKSAFGLCTSIKSITIPKSVTSIGSWAFADWSKTQTIYVRGNDYRPSGWDVKWNEDCSAKIEWNA